MSSSEDDSDSPLIDDASGLPILFLGCNESMPKYTLNSHRHRVRKRPWSYTRRPQKPANADSVNVAGQLNEYEKDPGRSNEGDCNQTTFDAENLSFNRPNDGDNDGAYYGLVANFPFLPPRFDVLRKPIL